VHARSDDGGGILVFCCGVCQALVGIKDPSRPEAAGAVDACHTAGVRVMMITGDSKATALAIARDVHILDTPTYDAEAARLQQQETDTPSSSASSSARGGGTTVGRAFTGAEFFRGLSEGEQRAVLAKGGNLVFCRTEPLDKQRLVRMLQATGEVVAMTGDGVNDAPALQQVRSGEGEAGAPRCAPVPVPCACVARAA